MQRTYQFSDVGPTRVDQQMRNLLEAVGQSQTYAQGTAIARQGNPANGFWLITSGQVATCRFGADGTLTVFEVLGAGDIFGDLAYLAGVPRQVDSIAEEDCTLIWISAGQVEELLATTPGFSRWLLRSLATQLRVALDRIESQRSLSAHARLARFLSDLATRNGPAINITQQELADYIGVSRVTAGQAIRALAATGCIRTGYRCLYVTEKAALDRFGEL